MPHSKPLLKAGEYKGMGVAGCLIRDSRAIQSSVRTGQRLNPLTDTSYNERKE